MRRGKPTANATWDNATAVLVGDYLIARSFNLLVGLARCRYCSYSQMAPCDIAEGEVLQLQHQHDPKATEADYMKSSMEVKPSAIFMMASQGVAILENRP